MASHHRIAASCYDLIGRTQVTLETKRCPERKMIYGPNFRNRSGELVNTTKISDMPLEAVLFINTKVGFTIGFLKYHANLLFRSCSSGCGVQFAYQNTFFDTQDDETFKPLHRKFRELYYDALFYYMVGLEWEHLGKNTSIVIGNEIDRNALMHYDSHCHAHLLPPQYPKKVTGLVGDGHQKALVKACGSEVASDKKRAP